MQKTIRASRRTFLSLVTAGALFMSSGSLATAGEAQDQLVEKAKFTIGDVAAKSEMEQFRKLLAVAKGVVVFPQVLKAGAQANELVLVVMTDKALQVIISNQVKLGGDLSAAVGPVGTTLGASTTTNLKVDVFSFAISKGLFIGASVEGSILSSNSDSNESYYGQPVTSQQIVIDRTVSNPHADGLRAALVAAEAK